MRVAHEQDYDTHAVVGGKQIESFEIAQTAEFFTVLSSTLYSNKPLAVVREVLCNAWDAHIASGRQNLAVVVTTTNDKLVIRDYGFGIPHDKIHKIYCVYGSSTKENDGRQTGGFGLGSKSPFAYGDHFTVDNHYDGLKTVHAISRGSVLTQGKPDRRVIVEVPTKETGVQVSIPIKNQHDRDLFRTLIEQIAAYGEMNVILDGVQVETVPISSAENNVYLTFKDIPNTSREVNIRYGNVIYPINPHEEIDGLLKRFTGALSSIPSVNSLYISRSNNWKVILQAPANSISVTPSREDLSMTETTISTVTQLMKDALLYIDRNSEIVKAEIKNRLNEAIEDHYRFGVIDKIPVRDNLMNIYYENEAPKTFTTLKDFTRYLAYRDNNKTNHELLLDHINRAKTLIKNGYRRKEDLKKFVGIFGGDRWASASKYFTQQIQQPLLRKLAKHEVLSHKKMFISYGNRSDDTKRGFVEYSKAKLSTTQMLPVLQGVVIIAYSKMSYVDHFMHFDKQKMFPGSVPRMVYLASRVKGHREAAIEFFTKQQYLVIDYAEWYDAEYAALEYTPNVSVIHKIPAPPKPKGLPLLSNLMNQHGSFVYNRHIQTNKDVLKYSEDFEYIIQGHTLTSKAYSPKFFPWGDRNATEITKLFGNKIGVAVNSKQMEKYKLEGKKDALEFIASEVCNEILTNPRIKSYLSNRLSDLRHGQSIGQLYDIARESNVLKQFFNIPDPVTSKDLEYIAIYKDIANDISRYGSKPYELVFQKTIEEVAKWIVPNDTLDLHNNVKNNARIEFLNLSQMKTKMQIANRVNDYPMKSYIEICIINALT